MNSGIMPHAGLKNSNHEFRGKILSIFVDEVDGGVWFIRKEVKEHLKITHNHFESLDEGGVRTTHLIDSIGRMQETLLIDEGNFYQIVLMSRTPEAKEFKNHVCRVILPQIRQTGAYVVPTGSMTRLDVMAAQAQEFANIVREMAEIEKRQTEDHARLDHLAAHLEELDDGYQTIIGYANIEGIRLKSGESSKLGRLAAKLSKEQGLEVRRISDKRFGRVGAYHPTVLSEVFGWEGERDNNN